MNLLRAALSLVITLVVAPHVHAETVRFKQDRFVVSYWYGPNVDQDADRHYKEIADAHFTMIQGAFDPEVDKLLELARKYDLPAIVLTRGKPVEDWPSDPYCWGYHIQDEPGAAQFPRLREIVSQVRERHPGKLAFINLFPNTANQTQLGMASYEQYVARFVGEVNPDVLCMDYYPMFTPDRDGRDGYCDNLATMRKYSLKAGIPFWNFFNTMPFDRYMDPTEAQLRWQVFASITYGAKGVLYFRYHSTPGNPTSKGGGILTEDGVLTRHYEQAARLNLQLVHLGPTLMQLTSTGVYRVKPGDDAAKVLAGSGLKDMGRLDTDPPNDYLMGSFDHTDGRRAVMITNYRFAYSAWPTVQFDCPADQVREVDKKTGKEISVRDESPSMPGLQVSLEDGEGRLFLLPGK